MKKRYSFLLALFLLAGCSSAQEEAAKQPVEKQKPAATQPEKTNETPNEDVYVPSAQVTDDIALTTVGKTINDAKGELTLKAYQNVNKTVTVGPIELLVKDVKVMHFVPDYSMIDFFHAYTHDEEFDFVKIGVEIKNNSTEEVQFNPVAFVQTSNEEHKTWEDDIYLEELTGALKGKSHKQGNMGFILEKAENLQSVEIVTSDAVDKSGKVLEKGQTVTVDFR